MTTTSRREPEEARRARVEAIRELGLLRYRVNWWATAETETPGAALPGVSKFACQFDKLQLESTPATSKCVSCNRIIIPEPART